MYWRDVQEIFSTQQSVVACSVTSVEVRCSDSGGNGDGAFFRSDPPSSDARKGSAASEDGVDQPAKIIIQPLGAAVRSACT